MRKRNIASLLAFSVMVSPFAAAESILVQPRVEAGFSNYQLEFDGTVPVNEQFTLQANNKISSTVFVHRIAVTFAYDAFYLDVLASKTSDVTGSQLISEISAIENWTGGREEVNLTLGYQAFDSGSVFIGYRDGSIEADGQVNSSFSYESDGVYIGANYGFLITDSGAISLNIAYAFLNSELEETLFGTTVPFASGDGNGLKFGIAWHDSLSESLKYSISIDRYSYETDIESDVGADVNIKESESTIRLGLSYSF